MIPVDRMLLWPGGPDNSDLLVAVASAAMVVTALALIARVLLSR